MNDNAVAEFATEEIEYLRHGDQPLMLTLRRPSGAGPFPVVVDIHGGAWNQSDRFSCQMRDEMLAQAGIAAAALDFRQGATGYPSSLVDINYAIRWLKSHAEELRLDAARVGLAGASSGGQLAMISAMRPCDARYAAHPLEPPNAAHDASVRCIGLIAPVINPLSRYRNALQRRKTPNPPAWSERLPQSHETYWKTEDNMAEASPVLVLARGESVEMPPAIYIQRQPDEVHVYVDPDFDGDLTEPERFVESYRSAGGEIELVYVDTDLQQSPEQYEPLVKFFTGYL